MTPDILTTLGNQILACACDCLNAFGSCPCPCRMFISAGPAVWDNESCCSDGALSVQFERIFSYERFPAESGTVTSCQMPLAVEVNVTLLRCFPSLNNDGTAPTADTIGTASENVYQDLYVLTNCIICNILSRSKRQAGLFRGSRILSPQGGCIGAEIRFVMELPDPLPFS